jgi:gamma-glutamylaminecyclotransferase
MRDGCRSEVLSGQRFLGTARTRPEYTLLDLGPYPGLVHVASGGKALDGELHEISADLVPLLDRIESAPSLFRLEPILLEDAEAPVWAYFYCRHDPTAVLYPAARWDNRRGGEEEDEQS